MRRIAITPAAYNAIKGSLPKSAQLKEPQLNDRGNYFIWMPDSVLTRLTVMRTHGEDCSDTIVRLAGLET